MKPQWTKLRRWWVDGATPAERTIIREKSLAECAVRARFLSYFFIFVYTIFGIEGYGYISKYVPGLSLWDNIWPRLLLNSLPLAILVVWLKRSKISRVETKLFVWFAGFVSIFQCSAWIYVWPTVLSGKPEILSYVTSANTFVYILTFAVLALPNYLVGYFALMMFVVFTLPLWTVAYLGGDTVVFTYVLNDTLTAVGAGVVVGSVAYSLRRKIILLELKQMSSTEKFLGKTVSRAIFEGREDLLERRTKKGFILALDIRGYTQMIQNTEAQKVGYFLNTYQAMVSDLVGQYGGFIHKTMGDGHLISFGLMDDDDVDLSDIPGIETELKQADERRAQNALKRTILVMDLIAFNTELLAAEMGIPGIRLGAGLEHGDVELRVFGDSEYRREFDIFGNTIVRATRLQAHTKALLSQVPTGSSLLIASPIAMHYATAELRSRLRETPTDGLPVRDCADLHSIWMRTYAPAIPEGLDLFPARERNYTDDSLTEAA